VPTSNGQVTSRDIRQKAVKTIHVVDGSITTPKIPDLAITFPDKIDDPIWSTAFGDRLFSNETIDTTPTSYGSLSVDIPSWVDQIAVFALGHFQLTNTSGGDVLMSMGIEIDGEVQGGHSHEAVNNQTQVMSDARIANLIGVAGSSITVDMEVSISTGTNSSNGATINGIIVGTR